MERTRIAKVEDVKLVRRGEQVEGTLHLTPHHLIFCHFLQSEHDNAASKPRELWITYPIIQKCTLRPTPAVSRQPSSLRLQCRDFTFVCFCFSDEKKAREVYDSIRLWTCKLGKLEKLYAFTYQPQLPEKDRDSWGVYDARKEWRRQGINEKSSDKGWRISHINNDYAFSPTYPQLLVVPSAISDNTLNYAVKFRSRGRLPVLTYLHPVNNCSMTRCAQPLVGVRQNRSVQDEKLLLTIFNTSTATPNEAEPLSRPRSPQSQPSSENESNEADMQSTDAEALEDEVIARVGSEKDANEPKVYGAQQNNLIVDARPTVNALAMQAVGLGSENMDHYKFATKIYLGIDNIHVMRDSLNKVIDALKETDVTPLAPNRETLAKSNWLKHISQLLDGARIIARQIAVQHSHVVVHCSDGWDRTSQLSALSQICLDPYYRTIDGFIVLIEKDWLSFGHQFALRCGFLSSEKWFNIDNERIGGESTNKPSLVGQGSGAGQALENALLSAKGFFNKDNNSRDSFENSDGELQPYEQGSPGFRKAQNATKPAKEDKSKTKVKETSPIFHQFLDATYQLLQQYPTRFEFNERFLRRLLYHLYSCQYGTFLYNNEKERHDAHINEKTRSVWDYFLARKEQFINEQYNGTIDDHVRGQERLILPQPTSLRWWSEAFGRLDSEMNGPSRNTRPLAGLNGTMEPTALTGVETASTAVGSGTTERPSNGEVDEYNKVAVGMGALAVDAGQGGKHTTPEHPLEVETQ